MEFNQVVRSLQCGDNLTTHELDSPLVGCFNTNQIEK
jgi:hypothetical protein